jgi:hypothetical protein
VQELHPLEVAVSVTGVPEHTVVDGDAEMPGVAGAEPLVSVMMFDEPDVQLLAEAITVYDPGSVAW